MNKNLFLYYFILTVISTQIDVEEIAIRAFLDITGLAALIIFIGSRLGEKNKKDKGQQSVSEG